jgi:DNA-directed RNA polymerase subunit beta
VAGVLDPTPLLPAPVTPGPVGRPAAPGREFGDPAATRRLVYDNVLAEARKLQPVQNKVHALSVVDVDYEDPDEFPLKRQKKAILEGETLARRLRGTLRLTDLATGQPLDERRVTLAAVPHVTDRGTYILNGTEYTLANQMRLRPGVFTRVRGNGELEAHVNVLPGKGPSSRVSFDPESNVFRLQLGQAKLPLLPILKAIGVDERRLREAWGAEIFAANAKHDDTRAVDRLYEKLAPRGEPGADRRAALTAAFARMELDPEVTGRTLGTPFRDAGGDTLLAAANRLVAVNKGEAEPDDRDHMAYQTLLGPEDLFAERVRNAARVLRPVLWKATLRRNLGAVLPGLLTRQVTSAITASGLGQPLEEVNPADIFDQLTRVSRMGEGGIPSADSVPDEARSVQPSHFGFVDPIRTPESMAVGVDTRLAGAARKGTDGRVYTRFKNARTGETEWKSPQELADSVIAFPGELGADKPHVAALVRGKIQYVPREKVDFELPRMEHAFNPLANLIPLKSTIKGQRVGMGSRMLTQALPLVAAEAPLVQAGVPDEDERSYEEVYGRHMGTVAADGDGEVLAVGPDEVKVRYADGKVKSHELYHNFPMNRKTYVHNTPVVQAGQRVKAGALLARSNYTDAAGTAALGTNLRTAYIPYRGLNFEDAVVISRSAAEKKLASEHMYQHDAEWGDKVRRGKNTFASLFAGRFDRKTLDTLDDDGVVKPGTVVHEGHPLVLMARERERAHNQLSRGKDASFTDDTQTWDHHSEGVVTDVAKTKKGVVVTVKAVSPMQVGDKLSGRYGDKGVIAEVVDDEDMPHGPDGKPYEVLVNPLGVITRTNPGQMVEAALGKIAALTGKPYKVKDFGDIHDMTEYAIRELEKHGLSDTEDLVDPQTGRKIPGIFTGNRFFMKLHHSAESKGQGRGTGGYTAEEAPAKGGATGSKRVSMMDVNALLSHGALEVIRDASAVRGQKNLDWWAAYMQGHTPPDPKVPFVYKKFHDLLRAGGINPVRSGGKVRLMAMTNKDLDVLTGGREVTSADTVDWKGGLKPIPGGLFDPALTGGHGGTRWSAIRLPEPLPNPVMGGPDPQRPRPDRAAVRGRAGRPGRPGRPDGAGGRRGRARPDRPAAGDPGRPGRGRRQQEDGPGQGHQAAGLPGPRRAARAAPA